MKFYDLDSQITFGKYEGKTIREIVDLQPNYIDWCATNLDHFYISEDLIEEIKKIKSDFTLSSAGRQKMDEKYIMWKQEQESNPNDIDKKNEDLDIDDEIIEFWH